MGAGAYLVAHEFTRSGKFTRGPIIVGAECTVGPGARLAPHVTMEKGSNVSALMCALPGQKFRRNATKAAAEAEAAKSKTVKSKPQLAVEQDGAAEVAWLEATKAEATLATAGAAEAEAARYGTASARSVVQERFP